MNNNSNTCNKSENKTFANAETSKAFEQCELPAKVTTVFDDIRKTLGIDFIPNMYKALSTNPEYLEISWMKIKSIMSKEGKLGKKTKDIIALTVSIMSGCDYCINVYNEAVKHNGLDDEAMMELYSVIDTYSGLNRLNIGLQLKRDDKPWYGCGGKQT